MNPKLALWTKQNIPDQSGKTFLVTGANSGLGLEIAKHLTNKHAKVIMAGRSEERLEEAIAEIKEENTQAYLEKLVFDLADLDSVKTAADSLISAGTELDGLINNAGVMAIPYEHSKQGYELQFAINHLGHFLLTKKLIPLLEKRGGRIVQQTSYGYLNAKGNVTEDPGKDNYQRMGRYFDTKLFNILFSLKLNEELEKQGSKVRSYLAHPGLSNTTLFPMMKQNILVRWIVKTFIRFMGQTAQMGSLGSVYAATNANVRIDKIYGPRNANEQTAPKGLPKACKIDETIVEIADAKALWELSIELTKKYLWSTKTTISQT